MGVPAARVNRTDRFQSYVAVGRTAAKGARITVVHQFSQSRMRTRYEISRGAATRFVLRFPFWGRNSTVRVLGGATEGLRRTSGPLRIEVTTDAGARITATFGGLPSHADIRISRTKITGRAPDGTTTLTVVGSASHVRRLTRVLTISPAG
jgi:hypothetical protein